MLKNITSTVFFGPIFQNVWGHSHVLWSYLIKELYLSQSIKQNPHQAALSIATDCSFSQSQILGYLDNFVFVAFFSRSHSVKPLFSNVFFFSFAVFCHLFNFQSGFNSFDLASITLFALFYFQFPISCK